MPSKETVSLYLHLAVMDSLYHPLWHLVWQRTCQNYAFCLLFSTTHDLWLNKKPCKLANSWSISVSYPFTLDSQSMLSPDLLNPKICFDVNMIPFTFFFVALLQLCHNMNLSHKSNFTFLPCDFISLFVTYMQLYNTECDFISQNCYFVLYAVLQSAFIS